MYLQIQFGPLKYLFKAHDKWGELALFRLRNNIDCIEFDGAADRIIHILEFVLTLEEYRDVLSSRLPLRISSIFGEGHPKHGWKLVSDQAGNVTWYHESFSQSIWTWNTETPHYNAQFQIPWHIILADITRKGGVVMHGGMAVMKDRAYLFSAPPGGGKSTTLSRLRSPWKVLADDAVLIWQCLEKDSFCVAPLPTWGVIMRVKSVIQGINQWKVASFFELAAIILLEKSEQDRVTKLPAIEAAQHFYRGLSEHPMVCVNRGPFKKYFFLKACVLAKRIPAWCLGVTLDGEFWRLLEEVTCRE